MPTVTEYKTNTDEPLALGWLPFANRSIFLRATIIAAIIGSVLTLVNQSGWVAGSEPVNVLQLLLAFLTPFCVVTIAQIAGVRQAHLDAIRQGVTERPEGIVATAVSHGIPARAVAIGLVIGSLTAIIVLADALLRWGDLTSVSVAPLGQAYVLPLLFGVLAQAISYRRSRYQVVSA